MTATPEHEKLHKVQEKSQAIGEFLEWLQGEKKYTICEWLETNGEIDEESGDWVHSRYTRIMERVEQLLAEYFDINLDVLESEKRAMLDELRRKHPLVAIEEVGRWDK